ncbi:hypothetical protein AGJ32_20525 [Cronobacter turicensis]|nr:hypothetical protein [Cronobacter turicensis]EGT5742468.1 hypothetical protein [Cronobacter turicensis]
MSWWMRYAYPPYKSFYRRAGKPHAPAQLTRQTQPIPLRLHSHAARATTYHPWRLHAIFISVTYLQ